MEVVAQGPVDSMIRDDSKCFSPLAIDSSHDFGFSSDLVVAELAYQEALCFFKQELKGTKSQKKDWIGSCTSIQDVLGVLEDFKSKEDVRIRSRSSWKRRTTDIWGRLATVIQHYGSVLDVLAQQHPEYIALAWGAFKFIFTVTLNFAELATKIAEAIIEIADALPQAELLGQLYQSRAMTRAIAKLYHQILIFCMRTVKWYKRGRVMQVLGAIKGPWVLEFQDIVEHIRKQTQAMRDVGSISCMVEIRTLHQEHQRMSARFDIQHSLLHSITQQHASGDHQSIQIIGGGSSTDQLPKLIQHTSQSPATINPNSPSSPQLKRSRLIDWPTNKPGPEESLRLATVMRERRRARGLGDQTSIWQNQALQNWVSDVNSAMLALTGSITTCADAKDFALDAIRLAKSSKLPVIWSLATATDAQRRQVTAVDILKSLTRQALSLLNMEDLQRGGLFVQDLTNAKPLKDWLQIFVLLISKVPALLVVLDATSTLRQGMTSLAPCWAEMIKNSTTTIKILLVNDDQTRLKDSNSGLSYNLPVQARRPRGSRGSPQSAAQRHRRAASMTSLGEKILKEGFVRLGQADPVRD